MKLFITLSLFFFLYSCQTRSNKNKEIKVTSSQSISKENQLQKEVVDTMSFDYFITTTDKWGKIPKQLVDSFIPDRWKNTLDIYRAFYGHDQAHSIYHENYIITFSISSYGVCEETILATYSKSGDMISHLRVEEHCDQEMSSASYSSTYFQIYDDTLIEVSDSKIQAVDYSYSLPDSIDDLDDIETNKSIVIHHYIIKPNGRIEEIKVSDGIYHRSYLESLSKDELRLLRNTFYARYGYIFKSKDLFDYFSKNQWYHPRFKDVSNKLTAFEKYNIELIKEVEELKK